MGLHTAMTGSSLEDLTAKGLMGMKFNRAFPARARESDWVNAVKAGFYQLRPNWKSIFDE